jgi:hypothetical protein
VNFPCGAHRPLSEGTRKVTNRRKPSLVVAALATGFRGQVFAHGHQCAVVGIRRRSALARQVRLRQSSRLRAGRCGGTRRCDKQWRHDQALVGAARPAVAGRRWKRSRVGIPPSSSAAAKALEDRRLPSSRWALWRDKSAGQGRGEPMPIKRASNLLRFKGFETILKPCLRSH